MFSGTFYKSPETILCPWMPCAAWIKPVFCQDSVTEAENKIRKQVGTWVWIKAPTGLSSHGFSSRHQKVDHCQYTSDEEQRWPGPGEAG